MDIADWWPKLRPRTQDWLIEHPGAPLPAAVIEEIAVAGGIVTSDAWWVGQSAGPTGFYLSPAAEEWLESLPDTAGSDTGSGTTA